MVYSLNRECTDLTVHRLDSAQVGQYMGQTVNRPDSTQIGYWHTGQTVHKSNRSRKQVEYIKHGSSTDKQNTDWTEHGSNRAA